MKPTVEQVAAFADGQLEGAEQAAVEAAIAADPALQKQVAAHRALRDQLVLHYAPVAAGPVPDRLAALLKQPDAEVVDLAQVRARRRGLPRWVWIASPALAASLVLAVILRAPGSSGPGYIDAQIAAALDSQLVAEQPANAPVRALLGFRDQSGAYCRAFAGRAQSGIACRDASGWKLRTSGSASDRSASEYRQAGSETEIMQAAQEISAGSALDAQQERAARNREWMN